MSTTPIRVLLCDDSAIVRRIVRMVIEETDGMSVVGEGRDGSEGVELAAKLDPDVVIMDVEMPVCDGIEAVDLMKKRGLKVPVVMFSSLTERGAEATVDALTAGACDFATKPAMVGSPAKALDHVRSQLLPKIQLWGRKKQQPAITQAVAAKMETPTPMPVITRLECVTVGVSTGGPEALKKFVSALPSDLHVPIVIVQHMPANFTTRLAEQLNRLGPINVVEASDGETLQQGHVYIAPGGRHLEVKSTGMNPYVVLNDNEPVQSCRPSVDVLFKSAAETFKSRNLSIVLTGMGRDGLEGARLVKAAGGVVAVQDEQSSVVWGMPGVVWNEGLASEQLPPAQLADWMTRQSGSRRGTAAFA